MKKLDFKIIQYILTFIFLCLNARGFVHWPIYIIVLPLYGPLVVIATGMLTIGVVLNIYTNISNIIKTIVKNVKTIQKDNNEQIKQIIEKSNNKEIDEVIEKDNKINKIEELKKERVKLVNRCDDKQKVKRLSK